jgi:hypothetical protein
MTHRIVLGLAAISAALIALPGAADPPSQCGGIAGLPCPAGQQCSMGDCHHPDCSGTCRPASGPTPGTPVRNRCDLVANPPPHYVSGWPEVDLMKDDQLFDKARAVYPGDKIKGHVGACWISDYSPRGAGRHGLACDYYVKSSKSDICGDGCANSAAEAVARLRVAVALGYCDGAGTPGGPVQAK